MKSIQSSCKGWAESIAAYRLLNNDKVEQSAILEPHRAAVLSRAREHECVAILQDTTELDYTRKKTLKGSGPLTKERRGFYAHTQFAITQDRLPLGVLSTNIYAREDEDFGEKEKHRPIEEKESYRWLEGYLECCELAAEIPGTRVLSVSDREGDIYEIYDTWQRRLREGKSTADWLIRGNQNRILIESNDEPDSENSEVDDDKKALRLFTKARQGRLLGEIEFEVKATRQKKKVKGTTVITQREARLVRQRITVCEVTPRPPYRKHNKLEAVTITVVLAEEIDPPVGQEPIVWLLLTSRKITTFEQARELINYYVGRWDIEVFHRVLKTGCRIEEIQLKDSAAVKKAINLYMIVAWRIMYLTYLGRQCPELPCSVVFEEAEWKSVVAINRAAELKKKPQKGNLKADPAPNAELAEPSLGEMVILVAKQGGYLGRKNDGPPGAQVMWQGLEKVKHYAIAWTAFGESRY